MVLKFIFVIGLKFKINNETDVTSLLGVKMNKNHIIRWKIMINQKNLAYVSILLAFLNLSSVVSFIVTLIFVIRSSSNSKLVSKRWPWFQNVLMYFSCCIFKNLIFLLLFKLSFIQKYKQFIDFLLWLNPMQFFSDKHFSPQS